MLVMLSSCEDKDVFLDYDYRSVIISEAMFSNQQVLNITPSQDFAWIELQNIQDESVNLENWTIHETTSGNSFQIDEEIVIAPGDFKLIYFAENYSDPESITIDFKLTADSGHIRIEDAGKNLIDSLSYFAYQNHPNISIIRYELGGRGNLFTIPSTRPTPGEPNALESWTHDNSFSLDIVDPSGLSLNTRNENLWTVSDITGNNRIFEINRNGEILKTIPFIAEDLEGITQNPMDHTLWVVEERQREIIQMETNGDVIRRISLRDKIPENELNSGLEGITIHTETGNIYTVNTRIPRLFIRLDSDVNLIDVTELNYGAEPDARGFDLSGMFYDEKDDVIWIVSDEAESVFISDLYGNPLAFFHLGIEDLEGIAVDRNTNMLFLVSDELARLFHVSIPEEINGYILNSVNN